MLHSGEENQQWPTCGQIGYITPRLATQPMLYRRSPELQSVGIFVVVWHKSRELFLEEVA